MKTSGIIAAVIAVLVVAGGAFALTRKSSPKPATEQTTQTTADKNQSTTTPTTTDTNTTPEAPDSSAATITYTDDGFSPGTLTVKAGTKVTIQNKSTHTIEFDSDPHPVHTTNRDLNVGTVAAGQSMTFTTDKTGTFGYHDHLDASKTGTLIVQ